MAMLSANHGKTCPASFGVTLLKVYPLRKARGGEDLPPGDYTIQMVLYGSLLGLGGKDEGKVIVTTERVAFRVSK